MGALLFLLIIWILLWVALFFCIYCFIINKMPDDFMGEIIQNIVTPFICDYEEESSYNWIYDFGED